MLRHTQGQIGGRGCDKTTRRANQQNPVQPVSEKYSALFLTQITFTSCAVLPDERGVAHVTKRAVGCGGRESYD
jgi:hypothetical protein